MPRLENPKPFEKAPTRDLMRKAREVVDEEVERSVLLGESETTTLPRFRFRELELGRILGRGGFCIVRDINSITLQSGDTTASDAGTVTTTDGSMSRLLTPQQKAPSSAGPDNHETRESMARIVYGNKGKAKYVVKQSGEELLKTNKVAYLRGIIDLAMECKILACLDHRNITKLRGFSHHGPFSRPNFFLVLDRLPETLTQRLSKWSQKSRGTKGVTGFITGNKKKAVDLLSERLLVAYDIASAMEYLHEQRIVYRDLKPDNCGFTEDGVTQLFDFGLARELCEEEKVHDDLYAMTGLCGAIRYMSPEIGLSKPYNEKTDVYSFAMLMHYFLSLEPPMGMFTPAMFFESVFQKGFRPTCKDKWSPRLVQILHKGWSSTIQDRPSFLYIMSELRDEIEEQNPDVLSLLPPM